MLYSTTTLVNMIPEKHRPSLDSFIETVREMHKTNACIGKIKAHREIIDKHVVRGYELAYPQAIVVLGGIVPEYMIEIVDSLLELEARSHPDDEKLTDTVFAGLLQDGSDIMGQLHEVNRDIGMISAVKADTEQCIRALEDFRTPPYGKGSCSVETFAELVTEATGVHVDGEKIVRYLKAEHPNRRDVFTEYNCSYYVHIANACDIINKLLVVVHAKELQL